MDIEEGQFGTLDLVEVARNIDNKMITNSANKDSIIIPKIKINMQLLSIMSLKTKDDLTICHIHIKSFTREEKNQT